MITKRQKQVLDFIKDYQEKHSYAPSLEEICKKLKISSVSTAHFHLQKLKQLGLISKEDNRPRSIGLISKEPVVMVPLLGRIAAGQPIEAIQDKEMVAVPSSKIPPSSRVYALRVAGNSMVEENINDGDIVLLKYQNTARNGEKVVALIDGQDVTLKKFYKEKDHIRLQPANSSMEPIIIEKDVPVAIQGTVLDVLPVEQKNEALPATEKQQETKQIK